MNQTITDTDTRRIEVSVRTTSEPSTLAKAITAFAFSDLTVRPCGQGLPPTLPYRQDDWTITEISRCDLTRDSITDREILRRLEILDKARIEYDHIYVGHQDKKPFEVPEKVVYAAQTLIPALAGTTVALLSIVGAVAAFTAQAAMVVAVDPVVMVALKEKDGTYALLEIAKWYD